MLALTGFTNENLKRLITIIRIVQDNTVEKLLFVSKWNVKEKGEIKEWGDNKIIKLIQLNLYFRKGILLTYFLRGQPYLFL